MGVQYLNVSVLGDELQALFQTAQAGEVEGSDRELNGKTERQSLENSTGWK
jgi:hypothetical protein